MLAVSISFILVRELWNAAAWLHGVCIAERNISMATMHFMICSALYLEQELMHKQDRFCALSIHIIMV